MTTRPRPEPGAPRPLPVFDGFPYLLTRVAGALRHVILLPTTFPRERLEDLARRQVTANRLDTCLVLGADACVSYAADGVMRVSDQVPAGGLLVSDHLRPAADLPLTDEMARRAEHLARRRPTEGFLLGDLTKGGRSATPEERTRLAGLQPGGVPRGLSRCTACGRWRGECLDPDPVFAGRVMRVHCSCDNHNCCARCGHRLAEHRLNANYYDERDGGIWHVPGFVGLDHRCAG